MRVVVHGWTGAGVVTAGRRAVASQAIDGALRFTLPDQRNAAEVAIVRR